MQKNFYSYIEQKLDKLKSSNLLRELKISYANTQNIQTKEKLPVCFSSNDYLGLSQNKYLMQKTIKDIKKYASLSSTGSKLISGYHHYHIILEKELSKLKNKENTILFGSGYLANIALLSALPSNKDLILSDKLNHASIIDGCRLSRANIVEYPHTNMQWIDKYLKNNRHKFRFVFIVSDALFSMDGDIVPLKELYRIANYFDAIPILDEAHSNGVIGTNGKGIESYFGIHNQNSITMGTLGKAFASYGAFVSGKQKLIDFLVNKARPLIYSTSLAPPSCITAYNAIKLIQKDHSFINKLKTNIDTLKEKLISLGIDCPVEGPIFPIHTRKNTMQIEKALLNLGVYVKGIRPPSIPHGKSRLRLTISAKHSKKEINFLSKCLEEISIKKWIVKN